MKATEELAIPTKVSSRPSPLGQFLRKGSVLQRPCLWIPLSILFFLSAACLAFSVDLHASRLFFLEDGTWYGETHPVCRWFYDFGCLPAIIIGISSLTFIILFPFWRGLPHWRGPAIFLLCALVVGPGLTVNALFKDNFGRPRPRDVVEFGGTEQFLSLGVPGKPGAGKSFPSGHASMGFYFLAFFFLFRRWKMPRVAGFFVVFGLLYGIAMGAVRVMQGGHFATDIIWAAGMVYLACWLLDRVLPPTATPPAVRRVRRWGYRHKGTLINLA
jgi:lipid A 4'-phosphatase